VSPTTDTLRTLLATATPGPWTWGEGDTREILYGGDSVVLAPSDIYPIRPTAAEARLIALAPTLAEEVLRLRGEVERLTALVPADPSPEGWVAHTPDGLVWFDTRAEAEAHAIDWHTGDLDDRGEGGEELGHVFAVVGHVAEVVKARAEDDSEDGEWCRELGVDYMIGGYKVRPGSGVVEVKRG
jgi:hypothetical protein